MNDLVVNVKTVGRGGCDVYIGRPSKWGNPFVIGRDGNRQEVIAKHKAWLLGESKSGMAMSALAKRLRADLPELMGKTLGCFCAPLPCHGDTLAELANG